MPVYAQPLCPEAGMIWTPGYYAYGPGGYYWVPGAWVPAPYAGALWTPPYWGWVGGRFIFHEGYWGRHVGYYGGINYGFGYMGIGFVGGMWQGNVFRYNTDVTRVNTKVMRNVYVDHTVVERNTIFNSSRVAYSGGPGGINHAATAEERIAERDQHAAATPLQLRHETAAMSNRASNPKSNGIRSNSTPVGKGGITMHDDWNARTTTAKKPNGGGGNASNNPTRTYNASHSNTGNTAAQHNPPPKSNGKDERGR
jgi:hypothetical protein